ncbi:MAG TPA: hypothetical protein VHZ51_05500 [Ktedonobacteraceae bacterium]|jgi:hypothetical protein|nr:hypothetical protein [Ktedonobacteraceae bacterium]
MRVRFNAVAGERPDSSLTGNTLFSLSTTTQLLMTYFANRALQISSQSVPSTPSRARGVILVLIIEHAGAYVAAIEERVRFARRRCGQDDFIDGC